MGRKAAFLLMLLMIGATVALADSGKETTGFSAGDYVTIGRYEQDGNEKNGPEAIEWIVLETEGDKAFVFSQFPLEKMSYARDEYEVSWDWSRACDWLDGEFMENAFTEEERKAIQYTHVDNSKEQGPGPANRYEKYSYRGYYVYLLSYAEAVKFFPYEWQRTGAKTDYLINKTKEYKYEKLYTGWWLRTLGEGNKTALDVNRVGYIWPKGTKAYYSGTAIRPVMWVSQSALTPVNTSVSLAETTSSLGEATRAVLRARTLDEQIALLYETASLYAKEIKKAEWDEELNWIQVKAGLEDLIPNLEDAPKVKPSSKLFKDKKIIALYSDQDMFCLLGDFYVRLPEKRRAASLEEADGILYLKHFLEYRTDYIGYAYNRIYEIYWIDRASGTAQKIYTKYTTPPRSGEGAGYGKEVSMKTLWNAIRGSIK